MANLSKREKFLVFLMALILPIALIMVLLIIPMQNEIDANRAQLSLLEIQKTEIETKITLIPTFRAKKEERLEQVDEAFEQIASPLHAAEFERWMLPLFSKYSIPLSDVILSETRVTQPDIMVSNLEEPVYRVLVLINEYNEIVAEENTVPIPTTQLLSATYTYDFNTSLARYVAMLDEIKAFNTTFVVSDSRYSTLDNSASITINAYSIDKLNDEETPGIYNGDFGPHPNESLAPNQPSNPSSPSDGGSAPSQPEDEDPYVPKNPK